MRLLNLESQQRHLRHLSCIFGRNFDPSLLPMAKSGLKPALFCLYFTLHAADDKTVLYQSEVIANSLNPSWNEFDSSAFPEKADKASSNFIIRIWASRSGTFRVIIRWNVALDGLLPIGEQLKPRGRAYEANTVILKMFGQYYTHLSDVAIDATNDISQTFLKVDQESVIEAWANLEEEPGNYFLNHSKVCWAYKKSSLLRVHCMLKAIHETNQQVRKARHLIETNQKKQEQRWSKFSERESLHRQIHLLAEELQNVKEKLNAESNIAKERKDHIAKTEKDLSMQQFDLEQYIANMKISHSSHIVNRESLVKVNAQLNYRRKQLAAELSYIFPIVEIPMKGYVKQEYAITGVRLPVSDALTGEDDEMLSVALGNTCHLVTMMAKFMELPLRYPMRPMGSRSCILDLVKDRLTDREREFPLFLKGREKYQFHYGVYLLNKDIAQLRYHCGLGTSDLRQTLFNLRHLFESKFGVRIIIRPDTDTLQQRISLVPHGRTFSENDETDLSSATLDPIVSNREVSGTSQRPKSVHSEERNIYEGILKSNSQGSLLKLRRTSDLPTPSNRTQMHKLIGRRSKKGISRTKSMPDSEYPTSADLLLQVPFEEMIKGNIETPRRNTLQELCSESSSHENGIQKAHNKILGNDYIGTQYSNIATNSDQKTGSKNSVPTQEKDLTIPTEYADKFCLECLRNGRRCTDCVHMKNSTLEVEGVHFDEKELSETGLYSRQYSDILLIPGPFDDHDQIEPIDDPKCSNAI